jgi:hypothetical protein
MTAVNQGVPLLFASPAHPAVLVDTIGKQMYFFPHQLAVGGEGVGKAQDKVFAGRGKNGEPHLEAEGKAVNKPLYLFVKKETELFKHRDIISEFCIIVHVFCWFCHIFRVKSHGTINY